MVPTGMSNEVVDEGGGPNLKCGGRSGETGDTEQVRRTSGEHTLKGEVLEYGRGDLPLKEKVMDEEAFQPNVRSRKSLRR